MRIKILGNGGALNNGLPYNAFAIGRTLLCEAPPDIMPSIQRQGLDLAAIDTIYISHLHGDHTFGLPFLILSAFSIAAGGGRKPAFRIVGPRGLQEMTQRLVAAAFTESHPCYPWMQAHCTFEEIDETARPKLVKGLQTSIFKLDHMVETFGFSLARGDRRVVFAYVADTIWCISLQSVLRQRPEVVLIDLNGADDDPIPVHLSQKDLREKAIPITGVHTRYWGTHLKNEFSSSIEGLTCATPGMEIPLSAG